MNKKAQSLYYAILFIGATLSLLYIFEKFIPNISSGIALDTITSVLMRTMIMFGFTFIMFRLLGKRSLSQLTFIDLLLIVALGSAVGDVMIYAETTAQMMKSIVAVGTITITVLIINHIIANYPKIGRLIEGRSTVLVKKGKILRSALINENMNEDELREELRELNIRNVSWAEQVTLEPNGKLSVIRRRIKHKKL